MIAEVSIYLKFQTLMIAWIICVEFLGMLMYLSNHVGTFVLMLDYVSSIPSQQAFM